MQADVVPKRLRSERMPVALSRERRRIGAPIARGKPALYAQKTFAYTQGNFRICENKFLHIQKNISAYAKIYRRAHGDLSPHIQRLLCGYDCTFFAFLFPVRKTIPLKRSEEPPGG